MISLTKEQFDTLQPFILKNGQTAKGSEGQIFVFDNRISNNSNCHPTAIKIFNYWNDTDLKECIVHKEEKIRHLLNLNKSDNVTFPIDLVYIDSILAGYSMNCIINCHNIKDEIENDQLDNFYNLSHIVNVIKILQRAIKYDLHHQDIYARDLLALTNIIISKANPYIVDVDSFEIGQLMSPGQQRKNLIKENILEIVIFLTLLITKHFGHISRVERLFEKKCLNSFEKEFLNYLSDFSYYREFDYLDEDILDELSNSYYMIPSNSSSKCDSKFFLKRK